MSTNDVILGADCVRVLTDDLMNARRLSRVDIATRLIERLRRDGCLFTPIDRACSARQIRNGLLLCNALAWVIIIAAVSWLA